MKLKSTTLSLAAFAVLLAGCEYGSSSGNSTWSGSYDAMNFSGTYRIATVALTGSSEGGGQSLSESVVQKKAIGTTSSSESNYNGELNANIVPGSVSILVGDALAFQDLQKNGALTPSGINGEGTVTYSTGTVQIKLKGTIPSGQKIFAYWRYYTDTTGSSSSALSGIDTTAFDKSNVTAITVSQTGQALALSFNNGVKMSGRFTSVRQTGQISDDTGAGANTYNAQFEVAGANCKMVGTLNYDYPSHNRMLDGSWTYGRKVFDVHAIGPAWTESGATTANETSN